MKTASTERDGGADFLPDFCSAPVALVVILIAQLLAFLIVLARSPFDAGFWVSLGVISLFLQWIALCSAAALCALRPRLTRLARSQAAVLVYVLLVIITLLLSALAWWVSWYSGIGVEWIGESAWQFLFRNTAISAIASALLLRYFYVQHQWRLNVRREATARIEALQARIRPHFLFNSLNTVAALIPVRPEVAENAVEDLSDLFRAALDDAPDGGPLAEEVDLAERYLRLEALRLGDRLELDWQIPSDAIRGVRVPKLVLQPLMENAVYHGIETRPEGGRIQVRAERDDHGVAIMIRNPAPEGKRPRGRPGHQMALDNVRQRLHLNFGEAASLGTRECEGRFETRLYLPREVDA